MKKALVAAFAVVTLAAMIPIAAQDQPAQGRATRGSDVAGWQGGPGRPGGPGGRGAGIVHRLNLTEQQREQVRAIMEQRRGSRPGAAVMELERQLQAAIFADAPDTARIEQLKDAIVAAHAAHLAGRVETELQVNQILTAEQRAKARELVASGPPPGRGRRGGF